jgi:hypothetical protein
MTDTVAETFKVLNTCVGKCVGKRSLGTLGFAHKHRLWPPFWCLNSHVKHSAAGWFYSMEHRPS